MSFFSWILCRSMIPMAFFGIGMNHPAFEYNNITITNAWHSSLTSYHVKCCNQVTLALGFPAAIGFLLALVPVGVAGRRAVTPHPPGLLAHRAGGLGQPQIYQPRLHGDPVMRDGSYVTFCAKRIQKVKQNRSRESIQQCGWVRKDQSWSSIFAADFLHTLN